MNPPKLTNQQKERLKRLEPALKEAALAGDLERAKSLVIDIQNVLRPTGHETRLMQSKNRLYETAMNSGQLDFAIQGFIGVKQKTHKQTRVNLEATTLLAICYLRKSDIDNAEPLISEVLKNDKVISSTKRREEFRKLVIERFDEEGTLFALKSENKETLDEDEVQNEAGLIVATRGEDEIFKALGLSIPDYAVNILFRIDDFSKKQLPSAERKKLPSPQEEINREKVGRTIFASVKRVLYNSLCDSKSEIYQTWFNNGMKVVLDKKYVSTAVITALGGLGIGIKALAISVVALIIKFGIEVYCERFKPKNLMELR
ncbi:hypothetical protein C9994_03910 [Marivirga lumbricoides]|uniref:Uncharacterized protein n=1 Tax=Marivirga lumbricoides TaxID=1046115 RepID=A0A2T4DTP0_9BACT|nr:hypothetical protein C9994_03910 [Marivirga lumbricoides]